MQWRNGVSWPLVLGSATGYVVLQMASTRQGRTRKQSIRRRGGRALRSIASRNGPFGLCQAETFGNSLADSVSFRFPSWQSFDGHSVPPALRSGLCLPAKKVPIPKNKKGTGRLQACPLTLRQIYSPGTRRRISVMVIWWEKYVSVSLPAGSTRSDSRKR